MTGVPKSNTWPVIGVGVPVSRLLRSGGPAQISRLVVAVVINAVTGVPWRTGTKDIVQVTIEVLWSHPILTDSNAPATVKAIGGMPWFGTASHHVLPALVVRMKCPAVNDTWMISAGIAARDATKSLGMRRLKILSAVFADLHALLPLVFQLACLGTVFTMSSHLRGQDTHSLFTTGTVEFDSLCGSTLACSRAMLANSLRCQPGERLSAMKTRYLCSFTSHACYTTLSSPDGHCK